MGHLRGHRGLAVAALTAGALWPITTIFVEPVTYGGPYLRADVTNANLNPLLFPPRHAVKVWDGAAWVTVTS